MWKVKDSYRVAIVAPGISWTIAGLAAPAPAAEAAEVQSIFNHNFEGCRGPTGIGNGPSAES